MIPRVKFEYQLTRAIFLRLVGEYDLSMNDDLRDEDRTNYPLLIDGEPALALRDRSLHGDYLFSYQPTPGTVLFLGYGSQADGVSESAATLQLAAAASSVGLLLRQVQLLVPDVVCVKPLFPPLTRETLLGISPEEGTAIYRSPFSATLVLGACSKSPDTRSDSTAVTPACRRVPACISRD